MNKKLRHHCKIHNLDLRFVFHQKKIENENANKKHTKIEGEKQKRSIQTINVGSCHKQLITE